MLPFSLPLAHVSFNRMIFSDSKILAFTTNLPSIGKHAVIIRDD